MPERDARTEVGRLSLALNGMLAQIQTGGGIVGVVGGVGAQFRGTDARFITDASHELRTPLTTMRGFAELYRQGRPATWSR